MTTAPPPTTPLGFLAQALTNHGYQVQLETTLADRKIDQLYIGLLQDTKDRNYTMEVVYVNDVARALRLDNKVFPPFELSYLQFYCPFPFWIENSEYINVIQILQFINQFLPLGSFGCIELTGKLYYRYMYAAEPEQHLSVPIVLDVLRLAAKAINKLSPMLKQVSDKELTLGQAIEKIQSEGIF